jgi:hypothetical protein
LDRGRGPEACTIFGTLFKKKEHKITNKTLGTKVNIYLEEEIRINKKFKKADEYHKHHEIQNIKKIFLIIFLTQLDSTFLPTFFTA